MLNTVSFFARVLRLTIGCTLVAAMASLAAAAEIKVLFPQARDAFQTNEVIDVSVVRSSPQALAAGDLQLTLAGADGSKLTFTFPISAASIQGNSARHTEHLHLNGWLLRPGKYTVEVAADGATTKTDISIHSHIRKTDFTLINWGRATGDGQLAQGEDSFGYNLMYMHYGPQENANFIRAGVDYMANCVMSGAHQMDMRMECDWSDPYVTKGGTQRVVRRALMDRLYPNATGVHFYDEPGLTWSKDAANNDAMVPHVIPAQHRSYVSAFGKEPIRYNKLDANNPEQVAQWEQWARWKLGLMDAAWADAKHGVDRVKPGMLSVTQSQYGFSAYTDGYYFSVVRSLPVISGHGGYHDIGINYLNPSYTLEMARGRDLARPCWYLPTWYGNTTSDQLRCEQFLSFQTNIQGMMTAPDCEPASNPLPRQGIVESNLLMKKLGPIFNTMPVTKPPVAMLYSLSDALREQARDPNKNYLHSTQQGMDLYFTYLAGKLIQQQFLVVLDEDVLDGTLASDHKAVIVSSVSYLDPRVVKELEAFAGRGGVVLLVGDCKQPIKGAINLGIRPALADQAKIDELVKQGKYGETNPYRTMGKYYQSTMPLAQAIKTQLDKAGIKSALESDSPYIAVTRQAAGDVEYLFAVNVAYDEAFRDAKGNVDPNALKASKATLTLADDGRPVYDAVVGGPVESLKKADGKLAREFRFGPGQMRVFARTTKPVGNVRVSSPTIARDLVLDRQPVRLDFAVTLVDKDGRVVSGSVPIEVKVTDPLGTVRHEVIRATKLGQLSISLPLAANDPPGKWNVTVRETLNNTEDTVPFEYTGTRAYSLAGSTARAVMFADDFDNISRFGRTFNEVTIVAGKSPYCEAAAARLASALEPWGIKSKRLPLDEAAKPRSISAAEAPTWIGLEPGKVEPGRAAPANAGFAVEGPVVLIGTPDDNAIISFLFRSKFLPYAPASGEFPGNGRGYLAWQRDGVGKQQESVTCIAYDEAGMNEAVGTLYEAIAGIKPLTRWELAASATQSPATSSGAAPSAQIVWEAKLPDRVLALQAAGDGVTAITHDGSTTTLSGAGKVSAAGEADAAALAAGRKPLAATAADAAKPSARKDRMTKLIVPNGNLVAVAYWGGTLRIADPSGKVTSEQLLPQDVTALAWSNGKVIAGLADGRVLAIQPNL